MYYRISWPLWKFAHKYGAHLYYRIKICFSFESGLYWAYSDDLPLTASAKTVPELLKEVASCANDLLEEQLPERFHAPCMINQSADRLMNA